eukprot:9199428-Alexandrium_andersonii.AAC.1
MLGGGCLPCVSEVGRRAQRSVIGLRHVGPVTHGGTSLLPDRPLPLHPQESTLMARLSAIPIGTMFEHVSSYLGDDIVKGVQNPLVHARMPCDPAWAC